MSDRKFQLTGINQAIAPETPSPSSGELIVQRYWIGGDGGG